MSYDRTPYFGDPDPEEQITALRSEVDRLRQQVQSLAPPSNAGQPRLVDTNAAERDRLLAETENMSERDFYRTLQNAGLTSGPRIQ